jgi:RHS repeat-associated protein
MPTKPWRAVFVLMGTLAFGATFSACVDENPDPSTRAQEINYDLLLGHNQVVERRLSYFEPPECDPIWGRSDGDESDLSMLLVDDPATGADAPTFTHTELAYLEFRRNDLNQFRDRGTLVRAELRVPYIGAFRRAGSQDVRVEVDEIGLIVTPQPGDFLSCEQTPRPTGFSDVPSSRYEVSGDETAIVFVFDVTEHLAGHVGSNAANGQTPVGAWKIRVDESRSPANTTVRLGDGGPSYTDPDQVGASPYLRLVFLGCDEGVDCSGQLDPAVTAPLQSTPPASPLSVSMLRQSPSPLGLGRFTERSGTRAAYDLIALAPNTSPASPTASCDLRYYGSLSPLGGDVALEQLHLRAIENARCPATLRLFHHNGNSDGSALKYVLPQGRSGADPISFENVLGSGGATIVLPAGLLGLAASGTELERTAGPVGNGVFWGIEATDTPLAGTTTSIRTHWLVRLSNTGVPSERWQIRSEFVSAGAPAARAHIAVDPTTPRIYALLGGATLFVYDEEESYVPRFREQVDLRARAGDGIARLVVAPGVVDMAAFQGYLVLASTGGFAVWDDQARVFRDAATNVDALRVAWMDQHLESIDFRGEPRRFTLSRLGVIVASASGQTTYLRHNILTSNPAFRPLAPNSLELCANNGDDNGDGLADCSDPACSGAPNCIEICDDDRDNDGDGAVDCPVFEAGILVGDPDCATHPACRREAPEVCESGTLSFHATACGACFDGADNNDDGLIDCDDSGCARACAENCFNNVDDNNNGRIDCEDEACAHSGALCTSESAHCGDGIDNDDNDDVDCADLACASTDLCRFEELCGDSTDDDGDGYIDCDDPDCFTGLLVDCLGPDCLAPCLGIPPDPRSLIPDRTAGWNEPDFIEVVDTLLDAEPPLQLIEPLYDGQIEPLRSGIVRGRVLVLNADGTRTPQRGVRVSILNHPQYGYTHTRVDGTFDLVVEGGSELVVSFGDSLVAGSFYPVQRRSWIYWRDWTLLDDVVMLRRATASAPVNLVDTVPNLIRSNTAMADSDMMLFVPATSRLCISEECEEGAPQLSTAQFELREYTVNDAAQGAMPGDLPPGTAYTFAAEVHVKGVPFDQMVYVSNEPLALWVRDTIGFPLGDRIPLGTYNRQTGAWESELVSHSATVFGFCGVDAGGRARLTVDGLIEMSAQAYDDVGIIDAERVEIATALSAELAGVAACTEIVAFYRAPLRRLSPKDINGSRGFEAGARPVDARPHVEGRMMSRNTCMFGSVIECENQVVMEIEPIAGTPDQLVWRSDRVPGRSADRIVTLPLDEATMALPAEDLRLELHVAGQRVLGTIVPGENRARFVWDGLDAFGSATQGMTNGRVRIGRRWPIAIFTSVCPSAFGSWSVGCEGAIRLRPAGHDWLWTEADVNLARFDATPIGLGGWAPGSLHMLSTSGSAIVPPSGPPVSVEAVPDHAADAAPPYRPTTDVLATLGSLPDGSLLVGEVAPTPGSVWDLEVDIGYVRRFSRMDSDEGASGALQFLVGFEVDALIGVHALDAARIDIVYRRDATTRHLRLGAPIGEFCNGSGVCRGVGDLLDIVGSVAPFADTVFDRPLSIAATASAVAGDGSLFVAGPPPVGSPLVGTSVIRIYAEIPSILAAEPAECTPVTDVPVSASAACLGTVRDIEIASDGALYLLSEPDGIASPHSRWTVLRIDSFGRVAGDREPIDPMVTRIAGRLDGGGLCGASDVVPFVCEGAPGTEIAFTDVTDIGLARDGTIYIRENAAARIRYVTPEATTLTLIGSVASSDLPEAPVRIAGPGLSPLPASDGRALLTVAPDAVHYSDVGGRTRSIALGLGRPTASRELAVPGSPTLFVFDESGRHIETLDRSTRAKQWTFAYDDSGRLASWSWYQHGVEQQITVLRTADSVTLRGPWGDETVLELDEAGYIESVASRGLVGTSYEHHAGPASRGLLMNRSRVSGSKADGPITSFEYDSAGRFRREWLNASAEVYGAQWVNVVDEPTTDGGRRTLVDRGYGDTVDPSELATQTTTIDEPRDGLLTTRTIDPDGAGPALPTVIVEQPIGNTSTTAPDGSRIDTYVRPDPVWGMAAPERLMRRLLVGGEGAEGETHTLLVDVRSEVCGDPAVPNYSACSPAMRIGDGGFSRVQAQARNTWVRFTDITVRGGGYDEVGAQERTTRITTRRQEVAGSIQTTTRIESPSCFVADSEQCLWSETVVDAFGGLISAQRPVAGSSPVPVARAQYDDEGRVVHQWVETPGVRRGVRTQYASRTGRVRAQGIDIAPPVDPGERPPATLFTTNTDTRLLASTSRARGTWSSAGFFQDVESAESIGFDYDSFGRTDTLTTARRNDHTFVYDGWGFVSTHIAPMVAGEATALYEYTYNNDRLLTSIDLPAGISGVAPHIEIENDALGRARLVEVSEGATVRHRIETGIDEATGRVERIDRDDVLFWLSSEPRRSSVAFSRPSPLVSLTEWTHAAFGPISVVHGADALLQPASQSIAGATGATGTITRRFDADGLLEEVRNGATLEANLTRHGGSGEIVAIDLLGASESRVRWEATAYNQLGELDESSWTATIGGSPSTLRLSDPTISGSGGLSRVYESGSTVTTANSTLYTFDQVTGRLLGAAVTEGLLSHTFEYDWANGGRLSRQYSDHPLRPIDRANFIYDERDRLLSFAYRTSPSTSAVEYTYNPDGSVASEWRAEGGARYPLYDAMGQLRRVTVYPASGGQLVVDYGVDALGRRASRTVTVVDPGPGLPAGVTPGTIGWVYGDGPNPIAEFDEAGRLRKHFVYLTGSHVPTYYTEYNTLGQRIGTRALITDERHSVRAVVDTTTGAILQTLRYDPFGYVIEETGAGTQPFGFAGGLYDPATGYVRFGFRDYDPNIGRWTAPDPIGFGGGDDDLYGYVGGDPVNRVDPWGLLSMLFVRDSARIYLIDDDASWTPGDPSDIVQTGVATSGEPDLMFGGIVAEEAEGVSFQGPIPSGEYFFNASEISDPHLLWDIFLRQLWNNRDDWGDWRAPLRNIPDAGHPVHGRDRFFIHGGARPGSAGCIDIGGGRLGNNFTNLILQMAAADRDGVIRVFVR